MFPAYNLTGKTWASLVRSDPRADKGAEVSIYEPPTGSGLLNRGNARYQILVPSYIVMFAYFLVLTVGWLFVAERRQGTLKRLRAAPLSRSQILLGKLVPCFLLSIAQGLFLLLAGKLVFAMSWGPDPWLLVPVVVATSLSAMGMALLVASVAKSEAQVAIYGTLLVLVLAGISGCLMGDRDLMPEQMQRISLITPHAWALVAYKQLLANPVAPNLLLVGQACAVLVAFGMVFLVLAWWSLRLDAET
jgi:ABC-2 type transport system permease protein